MKFKKVYIEITNLCNFHCSFCFADKRPTHFLSPQEFNIIIQKIRPYTDYIYLHVLGEPLLHPQLKQLLEIAMSAGLKVNLTTNGSLLQKKSDELTGTSVRQINISLHDLEENIPEKNINEKLTGILDTALKLSSSGIYISLRLWNKVKEEINAFTELAISTIESVYQIKIDPDNIPENYHTNIALKERIFLQFAPRFSWPDGKNELQGTPRTCYALRDQIAILSNGTVVPCCIDAGAELKLGNIFQEDLSSILQNPLALRMRSGFQKKLFSEDFCKSCGFIIQSGQS